jgi:hypothetical protein
MSKYIVKFVLIVFGVAVGIALVATVIWYFLSAKANIHYSSVLFWCGLGLIGLGILLLGGMVSVIWRLVIIDQQMRLIRMTWPTVRA